MTKRLRHLDSNKVTEMLSFGLRHVLHHFSALDIDYPCSSCIIGKGKTLSFPLYHGVSTAPFDSVHIDVWGIAPIISHFGFKYFVTFIHYYSCFTWVYFLHSRSEFSFYVFSDFLKMIEL